MSVNKTNLLSGRAQLVPYANLTADRYQFLSLNQAEPSLGSGISGNVLTISTGNTRVWSADLNIVSANLSGDLSVVGNISSNPISTAQFGNLTLADTTISTTLANGNIILAATGNQMVTITGTLGVIIPGGSTAQRPGYPGYSTTPVGTFRLNTGLNQFEMWDGSTWLTGSGTTGNTTITDQQITPDGISGTYTLVETASQSSVLVSINGTGQLPGVAYTVTGNTITFNEIPLTSDIIDIRFLAAALSHDMIYNSDGSASIVVQDSANIIFTSGVVDMTATQSLRLPSYTVAQAANIATPATGQVIYVADGDTGSPCLAVYSGGSWKRISLGATISI